jgi:hypothetical protein
MNTKKWGLPLSPFESKSSLEKIQPISLDYPQPPRFPSFNELLEESKEESPTKPKGLFEELFQSRPEALYQDSLDHPEKYTQEVHMILRELIEKRRAPTDEERQKINLSVIDFMQAPRQEAAAPRPRPAPKVTAPREKEDASTFQEMTEALGTELKPFWWL